MLEQSPLIPEWEEALSKTLKTERMKELDAFLEERLENGATIYPPQEEIFVALNNVKPEDVKVVLIGQDPYHGPGQAHGLSFSVKHGNRIPPSLANMFKEMNDDIGVMPVTNGDLTRWSKQGVLLLNSIMTVEDGKPLAHKGKGWEIFTDAVIRYVNDHCSPSVFILWGNYAKKKGRHIDENTHAVIRGVHPSPLSATRGFFGSRPFSQVNRLLCEKGRQPVDWGG